MSRGAPVIANPWTQLRSHTPARIALGRAGPAVPTREVLAFGLAHANARDAVHQALDADALETELRIAGYAPVRVHSAAPDRATYLKRPNLGRHLDAASAGRLAPPAQPPQIVIAIEDGLSAVAVQRHAPPILAALREISPARWAGIPIVVALQGRVALGDEIGERLAARLIVVMIGERPGLSSPDSLGLYITHAPRAGRTDAERNCISNVRPEGMAYATAAAKLDWLAAEALRRGLSGVALKDESHAAAPDTASIASVPVQNIPEIGSSSRS
jgi:ethanolamine ammonia-lyase small subunit